MTNRTKVTVFVILTFPVVLIGALAWVIYTALASGWSIMDAIAEELLRNV